jgi:RHS repeat-associated protein
MKKYLICAVAAAASCSVVGQPVPKPPVSPTPVVRFEYDAQGNPTRSIQAPNVTGFGFANTTSYDRLNRPVSKLDARNGTTRMGYDGQDNLTTVSDPRRLVTQYPRDGLGQTTQLISPDTGTASQTYDAAGNLKTRLDSRGVQAFYSYDALNRLVNITYSRSGTSSRQSFSWGYDMTGPDYGAGVGRLSRTDHPNGATRWAYDRQGRVTQNYGRINAATGANSAQVVLGALSAFNALGQQTSLTYPSGRKLSMTYTSAKLSGLSLGKDATTIPVPLLSQIQWEPFGDVKGWQWNMNTGQQAVTYTRDTSGRLVRYTLGGLYRDLTYDEANRIKAYTHRQRSDNAVSPVYDQSFGYDELGRLTKIGAQGTSWSIGYDANGNRTSVTVNGTASAYTTPATSNRLASLTNPARALSYDAMGNTVTDTGKGYTATYDLAGRLTTVTKAGITTTYTYDGLGRRIRKASSTGAASTVLFAYGQGGEILGEYDSTGKALREYIWMAGRPVAMFTPDPVNPTINPPLVYFIHTDHLNTPRVVVDRNDKRRWRWLVEPFGNAAPEANPEGLGVFTQNLRFPGQYADTESGLFYNFYRDLDPSSGRYVQSDPVGLAGGINTFAYVGGNPLSGIDPSGLDCVNAMGVTSCNTPFGPIQFPTPSGWPATINPSGPNYHAYNVPVSLDGRDPNCVMNGIINNPTPGSPLSASIQGTLNNATPATAQSIFDGIDWLSSFGNDSGGYNNSPVLSYSMNGGTIVVNVTMPGHPLFPGYVVRGVRGGQVINYGEGTGRLQGSLSQRMGLAGQINGVWNSQTQGIVNGCSCAR